MADQSKSPIERLEHNRNCRERAAVRCGDNVYEQLRVRIVRITREREDVPCAAAELGLSESTLRKYLNFVTFERLMRRQPETYLRHWPERGKK